MSENKRPNLSEFVPGSLWLLVSNIPKQPVFVVRVTKVNHVLGDINITAYELDDDYKDPKNFGDLWNIHYERPQSKDPKDLYLMVDPDVRGATEYVSVITDSDKNLIEWKTIAALVVLGPEHTSEVLRVQSEIVQRHKLEH